MNGEPSCPRCQVGVMRTWAELSDEEREVVRRLPGAVDFSATERQATHQWCTRCWHEETGSAQTYLT